MYRATKNFIKENVLSIWLTFLILFSAGCMAQTASAIDSVSNTVPEAELVDQIIGFHFAGCFVLSAGFFFAYISIKEK